MAIFNKKSLKYGSLSIAMVLVVIAIAVFINLGIGMIQDKGILNTKFDLTSNKKYSISDKTKAALQKLNKDVEINALLDVSNMNLNDDTKQIKEVLSQYEKVSSHIKVKYIDPDKNPGLVSSIDPSGLKDLVKGDFVVKCGKKVKKVSISELVQTTLDQNQQPTGTEFTGEQAFTGAIRYVISDKTPVVYFTEGHGEGKLDTEYTFLKKQLETNNYEVKSINMVTGTSVPQDAEILIVASPQSDMSSVEKDKVGEYLKNGGKAVFLFDYLDKSTKFSEFEDLLKNFNVGLNYDRVKETDSKRYYPKNPTVVLLDTQKSNVIRGLQSEQVLLANSRSINVLKNNKDYITVTSLLKTSPTAVGEQIDKTNGKDLNGPLDIGVAVENKGGSKISKVIVLGNGYFVNDRAYQTYGQQGFATNNDFFLRSLNWMMDKKDDVIIESKSNEVPRMNIPSESQAWIITGILVIALPLIILISGFVVWSRRRHL